jgi:CHAT domain-containing protein
VGKQRLIIVPSGILHYLPFEALLTKGEERALPTTTPAQLPYLLRDYAISYVPSAAVLASLRNRPAKSTVAKSFLAFADPVYGDLTESPAGLTPSNLSDAFGDQRPWRLGRLIESRREVEQISAFFPKDQVSLLLREQASEENAKTAGRFNQFRFVHFATHGLLNEEKPSHSGLILNLDGTPQSEDGLLQAYEIFNLKLNADLVVLSGCETGLGKEVKGEGLVGLTHAFFYAGTPSLVVSLWKVQDRSTADLMVNLYREIGRTQTKSEALRQAKLKLIQQGRYADPYYWAPFVLTGDPD